MQQGETVQLSNYRKMTRLDLFMKSLELDPGNSRTCRSLGAALQPGEHVTLADGTTCDGRALLLRALRLDPGDARALTLLADSLPPGEALQLSPDGPPQTSHDLLFEALRLDDSLAQAYNSLALAWTDAPAATQLLPDGRRWGRRELFIRAIELDPALASAFRGLAGTMVGLPDCVQLADGSQMMRKDLLMKAMALERWERKANDKLTKERWRPVTGLHGERWRPPVQDVLPPPTPRPAAVRRFHPPRHVPAP